MDARLLSPEAIRHNSQHAAMEAEEHGVFVAVKGTILHYLNFAVLVTEIKEDADEDEAIITLLHPTGMVEQVRYDVMQILYEADAVHIGCDDALDTFFHLTGLRNLPPPTMDEARRQRAILAKLVLMLGQPSNGDWSGLDDEDMIPLQFDIMVGDLKEARRALGEMIP